MGSTLLEFDVVVVARMGRDGLFIVLIAITWNEQDPRLSAAFDEKIR